MLSKTMYIFVYVWFLLPNKILFKPTQTAAQGLWVQCLLNMFNRPANDIKKGVKYGSRRLISPTWSWNENVFMSSAKNKDSDQQAHQRGLIGVFCSLSRGYE